MNIHHTFIKLSNYLLNEINQYKKQYYIISAVLDSRNNILSIGRNSYIKTHPLQKRYALKSTNTNREYLHAEIAALVKNRGEPKSIIIIRITKNGQLCMAKPCPICLMAIQEAKIKNIYYTNKDGNLIKELLK